MLVSIILIISPLFALEITIIPSKNKQPTEQEVQIYSNDLQKRGIVIKDKQKIKKRILEDRLLADEYLSKHKISPTIRISYTHKLERELADLYIQQSMKKRISDKEIKSYYVMHKDRFTKPKKLILKLYGFKSYEEAAKAYQEKNLQAKKAHNIEFYVSDIAPYLRPFFENVGKGDITPPLYFKGQFIIFEIRDIVSPQPEPLAKVAKKIEKILFQKAYAEYRKRLLKEIER